MDMILQFILVVVVCTILAILVQMFTRMQNMEDARNKETALRNESLMLQAEQRIQELQERQIQLQAGQVDSKKGRVIIQSGMNVQGRFKCNNDGLDGDIAGRLIATVDLPETLVSDVVQGGMRQMMLGNLTNNRRLK